MSMTTTSAGVPAPINWANVFVRGPVDLRRVMATFRRHWLVFLGVTLAVLAAVMAYTYQQTPLYSASASVMLDTRQRNVDDNKDVLSSLPAQTAVVDSEVEILRSRTLAQRVVQQLNLVQDPEFGPAPAKASLLGSFGKKKTPLTPAEQQQRDLQATVDSVLNRLDVTRRGLTYIIDIHMTSRDPVKAAKIANTYADKYLTAQLEAKFDATKRANQWLNERLGSLKGQVNAADRQVAQYQAQNGLLQAAGSGLTEQVVTQTQTQEGQARVTLAEAQARLNAAKSQTAGGGSGEDVGAALSSPVVQQLRAKIADEARHEADLETKYGPRHPDVLNSQNQLKQLQDQLQQEINRQIGGLQTEVTAAQGRLSSIQSSRQGAQNQLAHAKSSEVGLTELTRNADSLSTLYKGFLDRFEQTSAQSLQFSDAQLVSGAVVPSKPSSPNKKLNFILGLGFGLIFGVGAIVALEMWAGEVRTAEDVERMLQLPSIGSVPTTRGLGDAPTQYILDKPLSSFAESFRTLRASLQRADIDVPIKVLAITSALPGEGKSTTSFCLTRSIALGGKKTIVIDCDLRRRSLHNFLETQQEVGLLEVLSGAATLEEALTLDEASGAHVLTLAQNKFTPRDVFGTAAFENLLARLRRDYESIILDCAPVLAVADTRLIAQKADAVLFLVQWQKTPIRAVKYAVQQVEGVGGRIAGVALTQVDVKAQAKYGYGDSGYYYRSYAKYYAE